VGRLKGFFATVLWDGPRETLLCARDGTGIYPLFYVPAGAGLLASTSIDALLRRPGVDTSIDRVALAGHVIHHWTGPEATYHVAVRRLPPGSLLEVRGGVPRVERYWDPAPPDEPVRWVASDELERFDALFEQAVTRCLDLGRSTIFLSGGLDSVSVATAATDVCRRDGRPLPLALLMDLSSLDADETPLQTAVVERLGLRHVTGRYDQLADPDAVLHEALEWSATWPWPLPYPSVLAYVGLSLAAKAEGCRVLLTGEGGDEWLAVHPYFGADALRRGRLSTFARQAMVSWRSYPLPLWRFLRLHGWRCGLRPLLVQAARTTLSALAPGVLRRHRHRTILAHAPEWAPDPSLRRALEERVAEDVERDLAAPRVRGLYRAGMRPMLETRFEDEFERSRRTGLRMLHPFWDADLVDFLYRVPPELLSAGGRTKGLVRGRLARRFPGLGFETQPKLVLPNIDRDLVLGRAQVAWEKHGGAPTLEALGIVDGARLRAAMDALLARPDAADRHGVVWNALNLEAWARPRVS
jgi:asparagine synthase (glutamine-hydrolysing)